MNIPRDKTPNQLESFGRVLFSLAIIGIGVETLILVSNPGPHKIVQVIPWLPGIPSLVYPVGAIFIVCGAGLLFQRKVVVSSLTLGVLMLLCGLAFDVPRHPDFMSAEWRTNVLEPVVIASLTWLAFGGIPGWLHRTSRYLIAIALIVFGIAHFQVLIFIAGMVPAWIPWHQFWTLFFGVAFIAAGVSFATEFLQRWAALGAGLMFALWLVTIHLPVLLNMLRTAGAPQDPDKWSDIFIVTALWGGFWAVARGLRDRKESMSLGITRSY